MKIYFASDQHLGAPTQKASFPRELKFINWLDEVKKDAELADDNIAVAEKITIADGKKLMLLLLFIFIVIVFIVVVVVVTLWD